MALTTPSGNDGQHLLAKALRAVAACDDQAARHLVDLSAQACSIMGRALRDSLAGHGVGNAYDQPLAFERFIRGGGNPPLYAAVSAALARTYDRYSPATLLDIGAGDGMALIPALAASECAPPGIDIVEPNESLLLQLLSALPKAHGNVATLEAFVSTIDAGARWTLAQSTFALQSIEPHVRRKALSDLAPHVDRLVIVEFDIPRHAADSGDYYESLATRYELAASLYGAEADLVAGGFLAPMLLGQLKSLTPSNYEQPADDWIRELEEAGYALVSHSHVHDYSWAPAFFLEAIPLMQNGRSQ